jgi:hypothetical protein
MSEEGEKEGRDGEVDGRREGRKGAYLDPITQLSPMELNLKEGKGRTRQMIEE